MNKNYHRCVKQINVHPLQSLFPHNSPTSPTCTCLFSYSHPHALQDGFLLCLPLSEFVHTAACLSTVSWLLPYLSASAAVVLSSPSYFILQSFRNTRRLSIIDTEGLDITERDLKKALKRTIKMNVHYCYWN